MKSLIIFFSIISLLLCAESGFIKEIIGSVTDEVRKISDNTLNNVANKLINETTDILNDLGGLLDINKPKTSDKKIDDKRKEENNLKEVTSSIIEEENGAKEIETNLPLKLIPKIDVRMNGML